MLCRHSVLYNAHRVGIKCSDLRMSTIVRATIHFEPKIRTTVENSILLPEMKQQLVKLFLFT